MLTFAAYIKTDKHTCSRIFGSGPTDMASTPGEIQSLAGGALSEFLELLLDNRHSHTVWSIQPEPDKTFGGCAHVCIIF